MLDFVLNLFLNIGGMITIYNRHGIQICRFKLFTFIIIICYRKFLSIDGPDFKLCFWQLFFPWHFQWVIIQSCFSYLVIHVFLDEEVWGVVKIVFEMGDTFSFSQLTIPLHFTPVFSINRVHFSDHGHIWCLYSFLEVLCNLRLRIDIFHFI